MTRYRIAEEPVIGDAREDPRHYDLMNAVLLCLGSTSEESRGVFKLLETLLTDEKYIPQLKKMTDAIHEGGSKVFAQIMHRGTSAPRATIGGLEAVGPSAVPRKFTHYEMPRALTVEEIHEFVEWQADAALIAKRAGFDGIELETNSGYLYGQFWSPLTNLRTDEYGGSLENRNRFIVETLAAIREVVGPEFPIQLRVSGSER